MQRKDVDDLIARLEERARGSDCWCPNRRAAAALRALLAERDAAFAAGQEEMRERAAAACGEGPTLSLIAQSLRALPIKPRP